MEVNSDFNETKIFKDVVDLISNNQQLSNRLILNTMKYNYDSEEYWKYIIEMINLSSNFILENLNNINLKYVIMFQKLDDDVLTNNKFLKKIANDDLINLAIKHQKFDEKILNYFIVDEFIDNDYWNLISQYQVLRTDFIKNYSDNLNWTLLSMYQDLNFDIIVDNLDKIDWKNIPFNITFRTFINDETIKLFEKYPIWENLASLKNISTNILFNYIDKINRNGIINIIKLRDLEINQLTKIANIYLGDAEIWDLICEYQEFNGDFIDKYIKDINWNILSENYDFTINDILKYNNYINYTNLSYNNNFNEEWISSILSNGKINEIDIKYLNSLDFIIN